MSNKNEEGLKEVAANPYNRKKSWHTENMMPTDRTSADTGLFVPNPDSNMPMATLTIQLIILQPLWIRFKTLR